MNLSSRKLFIGFIALAVLILPLNAFADDAYFFDVSSYDWTFEAVHQLADQGVFEGAGDVVGWDYFNGTESMNRAEFAKVLALGTGVTDDEIADAVDQYVDTYGVEAAGFTDVDPTLSVEDLWYVDYAIYAKSMGWMTGYPEGDFRGGEKVNVAEAMKGIVESQYGTPHESYGGDHWYDAYLNMLTFFDIVRYDDYNDSIYADFTYIDSYLSTMDSEIVRADVADLLYRVQTVLENGDGSWTHYNPYYTLEEYSELYGATFVPEWDGTLTVYDPFYDFYLQNIPLGEYGMSDLRILIENPSGMDNGFITSWRLRYPTYTDFGGYSGFYEFFSVLVFDRDYFDSDNDFFAYDFMDDEYVHVVECREVGPTYDMDDLFDAVCLGDVSENTVFSSYADVETSIKGDDDDDDYDDYIYEEPDYSTEASETEGYMIFIDGEYGFQIDYPEDWQADAWYFSGFVVDFYPYDEETDVYSPEEVFIMIYTPEEYPDYADMTLTEYGDDLYAEVTEDETVASSLREARAFGSYEAEYIWAMDDTYEYLLVYTIVDGNIYNLVYTYEIDNDPYVVEIEHMIESFEVNALDVDAAEETE